MLLSVVSVCACPPVIQHKAAMHNAVEVLRIIVNFCFVGGDVLVLSGDGLSTESGWMVW